MEDIVKDGAIRVLEDRYAILQSTRLAEDIFAAVKDGENYTLVMEEYKATHSLPSENLIDMDAGWKIITFAMKLPFELVGFISRVSHALAGEDISIFVLSCYSTDHLMVKEEDLDDAVRVLESLGFRKIVEE